MSWNIFLKTYKDDIG